VPQCGDCRIFNDGDRLANVTPLIDFVDWPMDLRRTPRSLDLVGIEVDNIAKRALHSLHSQGFNFTPARSQAFYITLISEDEILNLSNDQIAKSNVDVRQVYSAGVGSYDRDKDGVFFVVIIWAAGQQFRKQLGLPSMQFHIQLSARDTPDMHKGIDSLLPGQFPDDPCADFLDHLAFTLHLTSQYQRAQSFCVDLIRALPTSPRGFLRLGDSALRSHQYKLSMLSYGCAFQRTEEYKMKEYCVKKMVECSKETEWGTVFRGQDISQISDDIYELLVTPWDFELRSRLSNTETVPTLCLETREKLSIPTNSETSTRRSFYSLPRFFRWLVPFHLAIMSTPRNELDIAALASPHLGIRHVLTLTEETPLQKSWFASIALRNTFLPIPNYRPPSIEQMDLIMRLMEDEDNLPLLVHCGGGKGSSRLSFYSSGLIILQDVLAL
jgi:atypical dual specificity phosphatase